MFRLEAIRGSKINVPILVPTKALPSSHSTVPGIETDVKGVFVKEPPWISFRPFGKTIEEMLENSKAQ
jgi:hypothetical protein